MVKGREGHCFGGVGFGQSGGKPGDPGGPHLPRRFPASSPLEFGPPEDVVRRLQGSPGARGLAEEVDKFTLRQGMVPADDCIAQVDQEERQPGLPGEGPEVL